MKISEYNFSKTEILILKKYRDRPKDERLKIRFIALLMLANKHSVKEVSSIIGVHVKTLENWYNQYRNKGIDSLNSFDYKPKKTYLSFHQICQTVIWVIFNNPKNTSEIQDYIRNKFGVTYCIEAVRQLLRKHGLKPLFPKVMPGNPPSVEKQWEFINKYNEMKISGEPGSVILFVDAMHLIHQNIPGRCWGDPAFPPVIETNSGRKRLNILGAYNPATCSFMHLTGEMNCNAERAIEFFDLIVKAYHSAPRITVILDNARYFHAKIVTEWLEEHKQMKLEFLPAYAPNLNLIERFWRFAKSKLVKNNYYKESLYRTKINYFIGIQEES
jgi:transposase